MDTYNKIMQKFWLAMTIVIFIAVTIMGISEGFDKWAFYYIFGLLTLALFFIRRFMMRHMEKHQRFLEEQAENKNKDADKR
ncbi:MAG: hypothetical protein R3277_03155 [Brumimicrobium sp.]|nr:hypothetical protein [Brumimicrobium sp.]